MILTGRKRYRVEKRCFSKPLVVLQVEEAGRDFDVHCMMGFNTTRWRDARMEDLTEIA